NVRLRSAPRTNADIVSTLSLGVVLNQVEESADSAWFRVEAPDAKEGWIFASLTLPFSERDSTNTYRRVIEARLNVATLNFHDAAELFEFAERVAMQVQASDRAEFELLRLRTLDRSLSLIHHYEP